MAATFYFPGLDKRLTKIVWTSLPLGLLYIWARVPWYLSRDPHNPSNDDYVEPGQDKKPLPGAHRVTITDLPGYDTIDMFANNLIKGAQVSGGTTAPAVADPVTLEMLAYYAAWTPSNAPPYYNAVSKVTPGSEVWVIDRANWQLVYNHVIAARAHFGTRDEALAYFQSDPTIVDKSKPIGVVIEQVFYNGSFQSPPMPPSQDGWAFWNAAAAQGWAGHMETGPSHTSTGQVTSMAIILNLTQIARSMTAAQKKAKQFQFRINWPDNDRQFYDSMTYLVKNKVQGQPNYQPMRSFPVKLPQLQPQFTGDGEGTVAIDPFTEDGSGSSSGGGSQYTVVTVKTSPLEVTMNFVGGGGGGEG